MEKFIVFFTNELGFKYPIRCDDSASVLKEIEKLLKDHESGETPLNNIDIEIF